MSLIVRLRMENSHHFEKLCTSFNRMTRPLKYQPWPNTNHQPYSCYGFVYSSSTGFLPSLVSFSEIMIFLIAKCDSSYKWGVTNNYIISIATKKVLFPANKIEKSIANFMNASRTPPPCRLKKRQLWYKRPNEQFVYLKDYKAVPILLSRHHITRQFYNWYRVIVYGIDIMSVTQGRRVKGTDPELLCSSWLSYIYMYRHV